VHELVDQLLLLAEQRRSVSLLGSFFGHSCTAVLGPSDGLLRGEFLGSVELDWRWVGAAAEAEVEH